MKSEPNAGPNAVVSFDALLTLALQEQTRRELAALPDAEALQTLYPDTAGWDKRLRRALAERRKLESKAARSAPRVRWMPLRRLVTVAAVLVLVLAGALATSAEVRYAVRHAVLQWTDIDLRLTYDTEGTPAPGDLTLPQGYADHYVPEGFVLDEGNSYDMEEEFFHGYDRTVNGEKYSYSVTCYVIRPGGQIESFDSEHTVYEMIQVNGIEATLGTSSNYDGSTSYYLFWEDNGIHHTVYGNLAKEEILKIAEAIY